MTTCVTPLLVLSRAHTRQQSNHCGWNTAWGRRSAHLTMHMNTEHNQPHVENRKRQDVQHRQDKTHNVQSSKCSLSLDKVLVCSPPQVILFRPAGTTRFYHSNWTPPRKPTLISFRQTPRFLARDASVNSSEAIINVASRNYTTDVFRKLQQDD